MNQNINYEQIALKTHISIENIEYLFNKEFEKLNKIKVNSFIAIIQRETQLDLSELKEEAQKYYSHSKQTPNILDNEYKEKTKQENARKYLYTIIVIITLFAIALAVFTFFRPDSVTEVATNNEESTQIVIVPLEKENEVKEEIQQLLQTNEESQKEEELIEQKAIDQIEQNKEPEQITEQSQVVNQMAEVAEIEKSIKVVSQEKVWAGIKYLDDMSYEETTANEITLDPNRDFVITFGHNVVQIQTHDNLYDFSNDPKKRRISYIDGKVEIITMKKLNALVDEYRAKRNSNR